MKVSFASNGITPVFADCDSFHWLESFACTFAVFDTNNRCSVALLMRNLAVGAPVAELEYPAKLMDKAPSASARRKRKTVNEKAIITAIATTILLMFFNIPK